MMAKITWLGDEDPSVQEITQYGHTFVKGVATEVPDKHPQMAKFKGSALFSDDAKADVVESEEPTPPDAEAGTEKAALKDALRNRGITVQGNPSEETLRKKLAEAVAKEGEE